MPKSAKKRKQKASDFTKPKFKLGKKQTPSNLVSTSFKARSIAIPSQSIATDKNTDVPTTTRNLSLDDLLVHLKHYNPTTRRDALFGLRELLDSHWSLLQSHLVSLINSLVRLISDEDSSVRKALISFLSWLLPRIPLEELSPHASLILLYTTSGQTHIFPEIRLDAVRVLDILLECIPHHVVAGWNDPTGGHGSRVLEGYLGVLNAGTKYNELEEPLRATSTASVILTLSSKLVVLRSLSTFLQIGLSSLRTDKLGLSRSYSHNQNKFEASSCLPQAFKDAESYSLFDTLLCPTVYPNPSEMPDTRSWSPEALSGNEDVVLCSDNSYHSVTHPLDLEDYSEKVHRFGDITSDKGSDLVNLALIARLARALQPILVATYLDCAPPVFSPSSSPPDTELQLLVAVAHILRSLYSDILEHQIALANHVSVAVPISQDSRNFYYIVEDLESILGYMAPYFPFDTKNKTDIKIEQAIQEMNITFCRMTALCKLTADTNLRSFRFKHKQSEKRPTSRTNGALSTWATSVKTYVIRLLQGIISPTQLERPLTPAAYISLLPGIWCLLNNLSPENPKQGDEVLDAILEHGIKTPTKSATKRASLEFLARLVLLETEAHYRGNFRIGSSITSQKKFEEWIGHLPQCLWELGASNLPMTEVILKLLLRLLQRNSRLVHAEVARILGSKFVLYFSMDHAVRGRLPGPYTKLPPSSDLRALTLDVVATLLMTSGSKWAGREGLIVAVDMAVRNTEFQERWSQHKQMIRMHVSRP
ncbi:hypothetical protein AMATHDRAFT_135182 [Amanita thiersii Skay4041]|uniref:Pre-rRNA-processing protein n=1 Tax=Amanita thiersii Skay4041 TaxID=703135 RepID=A0A2A9P0L3_9AGAR|nr:hypothetical protein AMATHDRAFT_135182 [Amanita thiersii Skay4041]